MTVPRVLTVFGPLTAIPEQESLGEGERLLTTAGSVAADVVVPASRILHVDDFGADPTGVADSAQAFEDAIEDLDEFVGGAIELSATPDGYYRFTRTVNVTRPVKFIGQGGRTVHSATIIRVPVGVTAFRVWGAGAPSGDGSPDTVFEDISITAAGKLATTTTGDYDHEAFTMTVDAAGDFTDGQLVAIEGVGQKCTLAETLATTTNGSPTVTLSSTGDQTPTMRIGQYILIPTAFPDPTKITNVVGTTLTMESNAASTEVGAIVKYCSSLITRIVSGGGTTTWTIDGYGSVSKTGAVITHADTAIDILNLTHCVRVSVGDTGGHSFAGAAFTLRGDHANQPATTGVNLSTLTNCRSYANRHAVYALGADTNDCYFHVQSHQATDWCFVDISHLGNTYVSCHGDGGNGFITQDATGCACTYIGCYLEGGTWASMNGGCVVVGGTMPVFCGAYTIVQMQLRDLEYFGAALTGDVTYGRGGSAYWARAIEFSGTLTADATITFDKRTPSKWIWNNTVGGFNLLVKTSTAPTVTIPAGSACEVQSDGTNMRRRTADVTP